MEKWGKNITKNWACLGQWGISGACLGHHLGHVCGIIWGNQMSYWDLHVTTHSASKLYETRWILTSFAASQPDKIFMSIKVLSIRPFTYLDKFEFLHIHIFGFIWIFLAIMSSCGRFTHHVYNIFVRHLVCNTYGWQCWCLQDQLRHCYVTTCVLSTFSPLIFAESAAASVKGAAPSGNNQ